MVTSGFRLFEVYKWWPKPKTERSGHSFLLWGRNNKNQYAFICFIRKFISSAWLHQKS